MLLNSPIGLPDSGWVHGYKVRAGMFSIIVKSQATSCGKMSTALVGVVAFYIVTMLFTKLL